MLKRIRGVIAEIIGNVRTRLIRSIWRLTPPPRDIQQVDYAFFDKARRGKAAGLEIAGLLIKPVVSKIAAWTLETGLHIRLEGEQGQERLNEWWNGNLAQIVRAFRESLALGDAYIVVNPDMSLTVVPPNAVEPMVDEEDFGRVVGWRIEERYHHPTETGRYMDIEDEYTATERVRRISYGGGEVIERRFPNLIGQVPVIHIRNNVGSNEEFGRPEVEGLVHVLHRYGEILEAGLDGNLLQGRPTPALQFGTVEELDDFWEKYANRETKTFPDGSTETYESIEFDSDNLLATTGALKYAQPGAFAGETQTLLGVLYWLIVEHTELPEFVLGTAIQGSRASADTQMPIFARFIEGKRGDARKWVMELLSVVLGLMALTEAGVQVEEPELRWEPLTQQDGQLTLATVQWALSEGLLDEETALSLAPVDIEDVAGVIERAREEREARREEAGQFDFQQQLGERITQLEAGQSEDDMEAA